MVSLQRILVPTPLIFLLVLFVFLFSPLYPVEAHTAEDKSPCPPGEICHKDTNWTQLEPPLLVFTSGFGWSGRNVSGDLTTEYQYSANPAVEGLFVALVIVVPLVVVIKWREKGGWFSVSLSRRAWRPLLWAMGLYFLVLSGYWSWKYMLFYVGLSSTATVDPFLVATLGAFILSGLGLALMMLAVMSRARWPVQSETEE